MNQSGCMTVVMGTQWGDEGKGKVVDRLSERSRAVCRYQGGHNAGHTLVTEAGSQILHIVPAGALHPHVQVAIGRGTVISPAQLCSEIDDLQMKGIALSGRMHIDPRCHLVLPGHISLDSYAESRAVEMGGQQIGTTRKGIGPAYEDRVARRGLRFGELADDKLMRERLASLLERHNFLLRERYAAAELDEQEQLDMLSAQAEQLLPMMADVPAHLMEQAQSGEVLLEGAQGYLLDLDEGSYPFVTSSGTCAANALPGAGLPPTVPLRVLGLAKAYNTRVGNGPFPTELTGKRGERLQQAGAEWGATTGRQRRCGWLDLVLLRRAVRHNGIAGLVISKLDVFDGWSEIALATDYQQGRYGTDWSREVTDIEWETLSGWSGKVAGCRRPEDLPAGARDYLTRVEELVGTPVVAVSTGAGREDWVEFSDPFQASASFTESAARYTSSSE